MPDGPKVQKRAAAATSNATGQVIDDGKDPNAKALGAKGGRKRAENMTPERRVEIARKAAEKRWSKPAEDPKFT